MQAKLDGHEVVCYCLPMKYLYRVVTDNLMGFEAQFRHKWWPFGWKQCFDGNSHLTEEAALGCIEEHKWESLPNPRFVSKVVRKVE